MMMALIMLKVLDCLRLTEEVDLGLKRPATLPISIMSCIVMVIKLVMMEDIYLCLKIPSTLPLTITEEVYLGLKITSTLPLKISQKDLFSSNRLWKRWI